MIKIILSELREVISHLEGAGYFEEPKSNLRQKALGELKKDSCPPLVAVGLKRRRTGYETKLREKGKKLTKRDALDIFREDRFSNAEIAKIYDVSTTTVAHIKNGLTWWKATGLPKKKRKTRDAG